MPCRFPSAGHFIRLPKRRYTESMTNDSSTRTFPYGIFIGVAMGIALGIALQSIVIGIGVGSGLAIVFGLGLDRQRRGDS